MRVRARAENGPFKINKDLSLRESEYGWDKSHNMIFVDQPIGTGFSYSNSPEDAVYGEKSARLHKPPCLCCLHIPCPPI